MSVGYQGKATRSTRAIYAGVVPTPDTWQRYLSRLGGVINGVLNAGRSENFTEADIVARAERYMQYWYPGPYRVESYYNSDKMKYDLRLRFDNPQEELVWILKWS